jgi:hypothetical protein
VACVGCGGGGGGLDLDVDQLPACGLDIGRSDSSGKLPPFTCAYAGKLGRARVSAKGVVTFTNIDDIGLPAIAEMVAAIAAGLESGQLVAR